MLSESKVRAAKPRPKPYKLGDSNRLYLLVTPSGGKAPPLFLVDDKGEAQLVNYRLRGRYYVVDRLFDAAELRLGTKRQQVVRISRTGRRS